MARYAFVVGRITADAARNLLVVAIMIGVGFAVGFRVRTNLGGFVAAIALLLLFGYGISWIFGTVGLMVGGPEAAQAAAVPVLFTLVFASSALCAHPRPARLAPRFRRTTNRSRSPSRPCGPSSLPGPPVPL